MPAAIRICPSPHASESLLALLARSRHEPTAYDILIKGLLRVREAPGPSDRLAANSVPGWAGKQRWGGREGLTANSPLPPPAALCPPLSVPGPLPIACCPLPTMRPELCRWGVAGPWGLT